MTTVAQARTSAARIPVPSPGVRIPVKRDAHLTVREIQVLRLVAEGRSTVEIASAMNVSVNTVKTHISRMCQRLNAVDRPALVAIGIRAKVVPVVKRPGVSLDPAERRLVGLIASGLRFREIAGRLRVTVAVVVYRVKVLMVRLGAVDRAHLVLRAAEAGFMPPKPGERL